MPTKTRKSPKFNWMRDDFEQEFNTSNRRLREADEEPLTPAEYLQCRLEDALLEIERLKAFLEPQRTECCKDITGCDV
jgi:hypothetical protein